MEKIRVLIIISRFCIGGPAKAVYTIAKYIDQKKFSVKIVSGALEKAEHPFAENMQGLDISYINSMKRSIYFLHDIKSLFDCIRIIRKWKPHLIHTHTAKAGVIGRLGGLICRTPVIHSFHGHVFKGYFLPFVSFIFILLERTLALFSSRITVLSESQKKDISELYKICSKQKIQIIPLGFQNDLDYIPENKIGALKHNLGIPDAAIVIGFAGRLVPIKNCIGFLTIVKHMLDMDPGLHFIIAGDGPQRKMLEEYTAKLKLQDRVYFTGMIQNMTDFYSSIDLYLLTSKNEGTPFTLIEAQAFSVPTATYNVGGVADILNPFGGWIFLNDSDCYTSAHTAYTYIPEGKKQVYENRMKIQGWLNETFSIKQYIEKHEELYLSCIFENESIIRIKKYDS